MRVLNKDGTPWEIDDDTILQYISHNNSLYVVTNEGEYIYPTSLSEIHAANKEIGYERLDRSNVINVNKVLSYDSVRKVVLFKNCTTTYAVVSEPNEAKIKKIIESIEKSLTDRG